ncbi:SdpI family protein, partial [Corynebacterium freneyi]
MIVIPVILLVVAVFVAVVAGLAWSAKLPGNNWVGIRAPEARKSRENWDITHRVAGPPWAVGALAFAGAAALSYLAIRPDASGWMWLWVVVAVLLGLAMVGVGGAIGSHTIALYDAKKSAEADANSGCCSSGGSADSSADGCGSGDSCCTPAPGSDAAPANDPSADCGVTGGCGSCGLHGMCEGGATGATGATGAAGSAKPDVDRDALRRA